MRPHKHTWYFISVAQGCVAGFWHIVYLESLYRLQRLTSVQSLSFVCIICIFYASAYHLLCFRGALQLHFTVLRLSNTSLNIYSHSSDMALWMVMFCLITQMYIIGSESLNVYSESLLFTPTCILCEKYISLVSTANILQLQNDSFTKAVILSQSCWMNIILHLSSINIKHTSS